MNIWMKFTRGKGNLIMFISKWSIKIFLCSFSNPKIFYCHVLWKLNVCCESKKKKLNNWLRNMPWKSSYLSDDHLRLLYIIFFLAFIRHLWKLSRLLLSSFEFPTAFSLLEDFTCHAFEPSMNDDQPSGSHLSKERDFSIQFQLMLLISYWSALIRAFVVKSVFFWILKLF